MSDAYLKMLESGNLVSMREWCRRPGKSDADGNPVYFTEQAHKDECDINKIIKKYDKTGLISHVAKFEAKFGDFTGLDFKKMSDTVAAARSAFAALPAEIREKFENNPEKLLKFMEDPKNRDEAIELGLIDKDTPEDLDGFGEHVVDGKKVEKGTKLEVEKASSSNVEG